MAQMAQFWWCDFDLYVQWDGDAGEYDNDSPHVPRLTDDTDWEKFYVVILICNSN